MPLPTKRYLGDSVYVEVERGMLKLTTENGEGASNVIYLETEVYEALVRFMADCCAAIATARLADQESGHRRPADVSGADYEGD